MRSKLPYVFISYSSKNSTEAEAVRNLLIADGLQSWMAPHDIPAGAKYAHVIEEAIQNCACVLLLLTNEAQSSDHVDREIERAVSYKKELIPLRLDGCVLNFGFRYYIGNCQIIDVAVIDEANTEMQTILQRLHQITEADSDAFRSFLEMLNQWQSSPKTYKINPARLQLLQEIYQRILALLQEEGYDKDEYKVTIKPDPLKMGAASISITFDELVIHNTKLFSEIIQYFDNFEIYTRLDNKLVFAGVIGKIAQVSAKL